MKITHRLQEIVGQTRPWKTIPVIVETYRRLSRTELEKLVNICCFRVEEEIPHTNFIEGSIRADQVGMVAKFPFVKVVHYDDVVFVMGGNSQRRAEL